MRFTLLTSLLLAFFFYTSELDQPWLDPQVVLILDPFQGNPIDWAKLATDTRVVAIIHRATFGAASDSAYSDRKQQALSRGYKWGSYHLGRPGDPIRQADFYLDTVKPAPDEVMALDIEDLDPAKSMTLENARTFLQHVKDRTGRYPLFYGNHEVIRGVSERYGEADVFSHAALWYARFKAQVSGFPTRTWKTYTLWQFKSEINCKPAAPAACPYRVPGTELDMDVNVYHGTTEELKRSWPIPGAPSDGTRDQPK